MSVLSKISSCVIEGNLNDIQALTNQALEEGISAKEILDQGLMPGMDHVGVEFKAGNMFVPEVLRSAKTMSGSMEILKPILTASGVKMVGKVILGTVKGDLHDIGKNLVGMMCEGAGFEVVDLGKDISPEAFVEAVKEHNPDIVGMSALLTTTMRTMESTIKALEEAGLRDKVKIMVGGA
ncbi:MAG: corrinoid protein, partial [Anaerolineales bacterium]